MARPNCLRWRRCALAGRRHRALAGRGGAGQGLPWRCDDEIRSISRDAGSLPQVETMLLHDLLRSVVATHEERTRDKVELQVPGLPIQLDRVSNICIYRFVQESLGNASRHADGVNLQVEAGDGPGSLVVIVRDGGHGFDPAEPRTGLGLEGMRERIASLGGRMISSSPGGTAIVCHAAKSRHNCRYVMIRIAWSVTIRFSARAQRSFEEASCTSFSCVTSSETGYKSSD